MENPNIISPATRLGAIKAGTLSGIVLVVWAVVFSFFKSSLAPFVFWSVGISVALLIVTVPSWIVGHRAGREYLEKQSRSE